ncbi:RNA polymerase sigma factor [Limibacter armeniacum]|uniref:RNA polymerase sigma factor n=1 Tax=Limibacter armeniacum TaxID=466084 RepID=UPI002FE65223
MERKASYICTQEKNRYVNTDQQLIEAIAKGDTDALQNLYDRYAAKVYNTALSYVKNVPEAEEITQDVFLKICKAAHKFEGNSTVSTWIYRIAINTALSTVKRKKRFAFLQFGKEDTTYTDFEHPGVSMEKKEEAKMLYRVIDGLPDNQKTAFILSYIEELPRQEVADVMEISLKATESLLQRAKKSLRERLTKLYPNRRNSEK